MLILSINMPFLHNLDFSPLYLITWFKEERHTVALLCLWADYIFLLILLLLAAKIGLEMQHQLLALFAILQYLFTIII